jgi:hypothetical protein
LLHVLRRGFAGGLPGTLEPFEDRVAEDIGIV